MQNEERINVLENQVRTLKRIVYGFGCLLVAGIVVGATSLQTVPDVIQAKRFEVVNDEGKVVVKMGASNDGGGLGIFNNDGKIVVGTNAYKNGGLLYVLNKDGGKVAGLRANKDGSGDVLTLNNKGEVTSQLPNPKTSE